MAALPVHDVVLDGESLALDEAGRRDGSRTRCERARHDRRVLLRRVAPRRTILDRRPAVGGSSSCTTCSRRLVLPSIETDDGATADAFAADAVEAGHEGVVVKALDSVYQAGRRGATWRKVKPVHTVDLVVLAAEWGHGRRTGWLSNLHLGARDADADGFVMVGKTFKGLTDELLAWQTAELQARAIATEGITVHVRPELVVEIALDGVQVSRRYPGGVALRFARVRRYRPDKAPTEADTIERVQGLLR
ncbi:MAG: hypothetical protein R2713_01180 [Ilumatobacteraceae bacterium]